MSRDRWKFWKGSFGHHNSSIDSFYEYLKEKQDNFFDFIQHMQEPQPFLRAEVINGTFDKNLTGNSLTPDGAKKAGHDRIFNIRFIEEDADRHHRSTPSSHFTDPTRINNNALRMALTHMHPVA